MPQRSASLWSSRSKREPVAVRARNRRARSGVRPCRDGTCGGARSARRACAARSGTGADERLLGEPCADLLVAPVRIAGLCVVVEPAVGAAPRCMRLAEVVEERRQPDRSGNPASAAACTTWNVCSSTVRACQRLSCSKPIAGSNSGRKLNEHARVTREPEGPRRLRSRAAASTARPSRRPPGRRRCARPRRARRSPPPRASVSASASSGSRPSCETNRRPRTRRSGSSAKLDGETARRTSSPPGRRGRRRGRRVSPSARRRAMALTVKSRRLEVLLDGRGRVDDDLEVVPSGPGRDLAPRRRELDPRAHQLPHVAVVRIEADADRRPATTSSSARPCGSSAARRPVDVHPGNEEVRVLGVVARAARRAPRRRRRTRPARVSRHIPHFLPHLLRRERGDRLDLDECAGREPRDLDGGAGRRRRTDVGRVDLVHPGEVVEVLQEHRRLHEAVERAARLLEDRTQVREHLLVCSPDVSGNELFLAGSQRQLTGDEHEAVRLDRLGVRRALKGRGCCFGANGFLRHAPPRSPVRGDRPGRAPHRPP